MERILVYLPSSLLRVVEDEAKKRGLSRTAFIRLILIQAMDTKDDELDKIYNYDGNSPHWW